MKKIRLILAAAAALTYGAASACTNFIVTRGASTDGSVMVTYAADSHALYGALYHTPGGKHKSGAMLPVYEWDTGRYLTDIPQVRETWSTIGNMNEHSLIIGETTYGGRPELEDSTGRMDYGSLIYITLQRAKTAREAIGVIAELADTYGYASSGESFSIADPDEAWIMELIGKGFKDDGKGGNARKGIVWVARRIPDGYVSAHANQARITTFPKDDPENCLYSPDVISFAREMGYYDGPDADFSFSDAYAPLDFGGMRACEARVWAFFRTVADDMDRYTDYAMGHNKDNRMPLWVKPRAKVSPKTLFDCMRDHYEGTPMDMTTDLGAGGHNCPYRWRPMEFEVDGVKYVNERATATQQTGFWFVAQARPDVTRDMGILWFGVDDAATSCLTPIFCSAQEVPGCFREDNGSMLEYSPTSAFLALQPHDQFRLHALRHDLRGHPQGHGQVGERHAPQRAGAQRPSRKNVARGAAQPPHAVERGDGAAAVRPLAAAEQLPAGEIHGRQRQERARRRADVPRWRRLCGAFRRQRQRETDSRQDPVPGLQREMEARRGATRQSVKY